MRLPNGYGTVYKLSGKRRRPFIAKKTIGFTDEGKQLYDIVGYFETRALALSALAEYNANPYDLSNAKLTYTELYEKYCKERYIDKEEPIPNQYIAAFKRSSNLHNLLFVDIRTGNIQEAIDNCDKGYSTKKNIKILANLLYKYSIANDLTSKNYAEFVKLPVQENSRMHKPFTSSELETLWTNANDANIRIALIYCYTGLRPTELLRIENENVFLEERYMLGGIKTAAGRNRVIPIAEKIYPFIEEWYNQENKYLITTNDGERIDTYDKLRYKCWDRNKLLRTHLPHDGRHTCATLLDNAGVNQVLTQRILGHASKTITQKVYTHKTIQQLIEAINSI